MNVKRNYILLCLIYFLIFIANALFLSFFQIFLVSKDFNESKIGIISSITPLLCIIANPLYSLIGKNNKRIRYLLLTLSVLEALVILLVFKVNDFTLLILVMCLVAMVDPPLFVILDSYTSSFIKEHNKNFSYIRIIGTFSYALGTFISGLIIEKIGYDVLFISASIIMLISSISILFLKTNKNIEEREKGDFKRLFTNKYFLVIGIYFVFILSFQALGDTYI
jgi:MFS family permease